jgi:hypothetical protein
VALAAQVPLLIVTLDYSRKQVLLNQFLRLSGDEAADMARIGALCAGVQGLKPQNMAPVVLLDPAVKRSETIVR